MPSTREVIPEAERPEFYFEFEGMIVGGILPYAEWEKLHKELGQELAKRIRKEA